MLNLIFCAEDNARFGGVISAIKEKLSLGKNVKVIVPEQFTVQCEKEIFSRIDEKDFVKTEIFSFKRYSLSLLREKGVSCGRRLSEGGRRMLMFKALSSCGDRLKIYKNTGRSSLSVSLLALYTELCNECADIELLQKSESGGILKDKLSDLSIIFSAYEGYINSGNFDIGDAIAKAPEYIENEPDSAYFFMEFLTFSPVEDRLIKALLSKGNDVSISFPINGTADNREVVSEIKENALKLISYASSKGIEAVKTEIPPVYDSTALSYLKKNLFDYSAQVFEGKNDNVLFYIGEDAYDEARFIANEINKTVRENGYRYREIAVIGRDSEKYKGIIDNTLYEYGVPCFEDKRSDLCLMPLITLVSSALHIARYGYETDNILTMLKTELTNVSPKETAKLQIYLENNNISEREWKEGFKRSPKGYGKEDAEGLALLNKTRIKIVSMLKNLSGVSSAADIVNGIRGLISGCGAEEILRRNADIYAGKGLFALSSESDQVYEALLSVLSETESTIGDMKIGIDEFIPLFRSFISCTGIGKIPTSLDEVLIGDANRTRLSGIKCVFLLGTNDGIFPKNCPENTILSDKERKELLNTGIKLDASERNVFLERLYAYESVTLPSEKIYFICNKKQRPSYFFEDAAALLGAEPLYYSDIEKSDLLQSERMSFIKYYDDVAGENAPEKLKDYFGGREEYKKRTERINNAALFGINERLENRKLIADILGNDLRFSSTSFEEYMNCRFKYFLHHLMKLDAPEKNEFSPAEIGTFVHDCLEKTVKDCFKDGDMASRSDEYISETANAHSEEYMREYFKEDADDPKFRYFCDKVAERITVILKEIKRDFSETKFTPAAFELNMADFADESRIMLSGGKSVCVTGKADRCDIYSEDGKKYLRIVDYKTGTKKFELKEIYNGFNMQLFIYLFSLANHFGAYPAGAFYSPAVSAYSSETDNAEKKYMLSGIAEESIAGKMLGDRYFEGKKPYACICKKEDMDSLSDFLRNNLKKAAEDIYKGDISLAPYLKDANNNACKYCEYAAICGFDKDKNKYREAVKIKEEEFFNMIKGADEQ